MSSQSINAETAATELDNILEMENVSVAYAGNYAVKNVSFNVAVYYTHLTMTTKA